MAPGVGTKDSLSGQHHDVYSRAFLPYTGPLLLSQTRSLNSFCHEHFLKSLTLSDWAGSQV